jgi:co-chaperonin GroES (HSP10)
VDFEDAVSVFLAEVGDVGAGGFEDPQAEQAQQCDQGEVVRVGRLAGSGQHRLELQVGQPQGRRLGWHVGSADMLGR